MERKTSQYENENGTVVEVHKVTEETAGGVYVTGVGSQDVKPGEYIVRDGTNSWTVVSNLDGYKAVDTDVDEIPVGADTQSDVQESDEYDPKHYTVDAVNRYLDSVDEVEQDRVLSAERAGKNRKGITEGR